MEIKPQILYRGIVVNHDVFESLNFLDAELTPPYDPIIDKDGNKTVGDGNEYGLYMTDNKIMVKDVYANPRNNGLPILRDITVGPDKKRVLAPSVGVGFAINTEGLNIKKPYIASHLLGHYNNGYSGDEWIADKVPAENYQVFRIRISSDILHDVKDVEIINNNIIAAKSLAVNEMKMRKYRLDMLVKELSSMSYLQRYNIDATKMDVLKFIYGENGVRYRAVEIMNPSDDPFKYLFAKLYRSNAGIIDFNTLGYLIQINQKIANMENFYFNLDAVMSKDTEEIEAKKEAFIERKKAENKSFTTSNFDNKLNIIKNIKKEMDLIMHESLVKESQIKM